MTIKIPVKADTGSSKQELSEVERSFDAIAKAVAGIEAAAKRTSSALDRVVDQADRAGEATKKVHQASQRSTRDPAAHRGLTEIDRRVESITRNSERMARVHGILGKSFGRGFSADEAGQFVRGFEVNRRLSPRLREFHDVVDFYENTGRAFSDDRAGRRRAAQYRREVMNRSMVAGEVSFPAGYRPGGGGGGFGGGDIFNAARKRGMARAKAFGAGMLAIAGVTSIMGMAAQGVDMATEEATGADTLKRSLGDLGVEFGRLRDEVRAAGDGLGVASVESMRLAQHFAKVSNADRLDDVAGETRNAIGFARAFGIDPNTSTTFFAQMRHQGVTGDDDRNSRRMAALIADAVAEGGVTAKTDELLSAVANFTAQAARLTLNRPNAEGYLGLLSGMTGLHRPGLSPSVAASIIGTADTATRRGGAFGEASKNFMFAAIARQNPGMSPLAAQLQWEQGLFGTARQAFGKGSVGAMFGMDMPGNTTGDTTNLELFKKQLDRMGASGLMRAGMIKNLFGLQSLGHAMLLDKTDPATLGKTRSLLDRADFDINDVSADALGTLTDVARADDKTLRGAILPLLLKRGDIADPAKHKLSTVAKTGDTEALRNEMARVVATFGQEETDGSKTRATITDLKNALTNIGDDLLPIITGIRSGVEALVSAVAPDSEAASNIARDREIVALSEKVRNHASELAVAEKHLDELGETQIVPNPHMGPIKPGISEADKKRSLERIRRRQMSEVEELRELKADRARDRQRDQEYMQLLTGQGTPLDAVDAKAPERVRLPESAQFNFRHEIEVRDRATQVPMAEPIVKTHTGEARAQGTR